MDQPILRQRFLNGIEQFINDKSPYSRQYLAPKPWVRILLTSLLMIASLFLALKFSASQPAVISDTEISINNQPFAPITLPLKQNIIGNYQVRLALNPGTADYQKLQIIPDDQLLALTVNGNNISLSNYSLSDLRNYSKGIFITLTDLLPEQANVIELRLNNSSNPAGLAVKPLKAFSGLQWIGLFASLLLLIYALSRHIKLSSSQYLVLILGLVAALFYLSKTDSHTRTFDVYEGGGHRDYIEYLIEHRKAPPPGDGWEYHQPPLYYVIGALSKVFLLAVNPAGMLGDNC